MAISDAPSTLSLTAMAHEFCVPFPLSIFLQKSEIIRVGGSRTDFFFFFLLEYVHGASYTIDRYWTN